MGILGHHRLRLPLGCAAAMLLACIPIAVHAKGTPFELSEQKIKSGLIYNILKYTTWPDKSGMNTTNRMRICLLGGDAFDGHLNPLDGRTAQQYSIELDTIYRSDEARECQMVFIHRNQEQYLPDILESLRNYSVLTVSDIDNFTDRGGMIELSMQKDRRIHLYINNRIARNSGLSIQDRLLQLAERGR